MAELIASVFARSPAQVRRDARRAAMLGADWLELRLDWPRPLPKPLRFFPPHGSWQKHGWLQFTHTMPASAARAMRSHRAVGCNTEHNTNILK